MFDVVSLKKLNEMNDEHYGFNFKAALHTETNSSNQ